MTVLDVVMALDDLEDEFTIHALPDPALTCASLAIAALEPADGGLPPEAAGMDYLLEVARAKQVIAVWQAWRGGRIPTAHERCEAVLFYAQHDAFMPTKGE